jgi:hypothetical protein
MRFASVHRAVLFGLFAAASGCTLILGAGGDYEECEAPKVPCKEVCLDLSTNEENCGACDNACPDGGTCIEGKCDCPAGSTECSDL